MRQRCSGVAFDNVDLGAGVADVSEDVAGDGLDGRIDVVEANAVSRAAVSGDGAGAETDDADAAGAVGRRVRAAETDGEADAGVAGVVSGGGVAKCVIAEDLGAVLD